MTVAYQTPTAAQGAKVMWDAVRDAVKAMEAPAWAVLILSLLFLTVRLLAKVAHGAGTIIGGAHNSWEKLYSAMERTIAIKSAELAAKAAEVEELQAALDAARAEAAHNRQELIAFKVATKLAQDPPAKPGQVA